jgi:hypothetical protein
VQLLNQPALCESLSGRAKEAAKNYTSEVMASRLMKLYDQITISRNHLS